MNRLFSMFRPALLGAIAIAALGASQAQAALTVSLDSVVPSGPNFLYDYRISIAADDEIASGDFFVVYDFGQYVAGTIFSVDPDWTGTVALVSATPAGAPLLPDNPTITNLVFTYTGLGIVGPYSSAGFLAESATGVTKIGAFVAQVTKGAIAGPPTAGTDVNSQGFAPVPVAVPEPSTFALAALAGGAGLMVRRRRSARA